MLPPMNAAGTDPMASGMRLRHGRWPARGEPDRDDRGDEEVQDERRRPHDRRWDADERHRGKVGRGAGMPDAGVEKRGGEEERGEEQVLRGHPATAAGSSRRRRMPRYAFHGPTSASWEPAMPAKIWLT